MNLMTSILTCLTFLSQKQFLLLYFVPIVFVLRPSTYRISFLSLPKPFLTFRSSYKICDKVLLIRLKFLFTNSAVLKLNGSFRIYRISIIYSLRLLILNMTLAPNLYGFECFILGSNCLTSQKYGILGSIRIGPSYLELCSSSTLILISILGDLLLFTLGLLSCYWSVAKARYYIIISGLVLTQAILLIFMNWYFDAVRRFDSLYIFFF